MLENKKWIALDISTQNTGYAIYKKKKDKIILLKHGAISQQGKLAKDRAPFIAKQINDLILKEKVDEVIAEASFYGQHYTSIEYLLKIHGFIEINCFFLNIPYNTMPPTSWRSVFHFPKNLDGLKPDFKTLSLEAAKKIAGMDIETDDEADAICLGYAYPFKQEEQLQKQKEQEAKALLKKQKEKARKEKIKNGKRTKK